jgi:PTS system N-acetylglucosamine-specific IIC component
VLEDPARIDEPALNRLGSRGVLKLAEGAVQVVVGPIADQLASEIRAALRVRGASASPPAAEVIGALGGRGNISGMQLRASRVCVTVRDPGAVDASALATRVRALARPSPDSIHLVIGPSANAWFAELTN